MAKIQPSMDPNVMGTQYLGIEDLKDEFEVQRRIIKMISRSLNGGQMVCVAGSGLASNYGYPLWSQLTTSVIEAAKKELPDSPGAIDVKQYFDFMIRRLTRRGGDGGEQHRVAAEEIMAAMGVCHDVWPASGLAFKPFVAKQVTGDLPGSAEGPLDVIIKDLRIRRFLTTNYDLTIEEALVKVLGGERDAYILTDEVALLKFAVGAGNPPAGVFHLHGTTANEDAMVVTEADYQQLYLREDAVTRARRQAMAVLLTGNPVLFVGMSLSELDLLHPLREAAAQPRRDVDHPPLFALLQKPDNPGEAVGQRRQIYMRYGIHVLFFPRLTQTSAGPAVPHDPIPDTRAQFIEALQHLDAECMDWWTTWRRKPLVQRPRFRAETRDRMLLYPSPRNNAFFGPEDDLECLCKKLEEQYSGRMFVAAGRPGSGKGGLGMMLVRDPGDRLKYKRRFYATLHFTNDFMSIIDAAADHLAPASEFAGSSMDRLMSSLKQDRNLLVLTAVERLLTPISDAQAGSEVDRDEDGLVVQRGRANGELANFLRGASESVQGDKASHVVLTSTLIPDWEGRHSHGHVNQAYEVVPLSGVSKAPADAQFSGLIAETCRDRLRTVLGNHAYLMWLVRQALVQFRDEHERRERWIRRLLHRLSSVDRDRRRRETLHAVIDGLSDQGENAVGDRSMVDSILRTLALVMTPLSARVIARASDYYPPDENREGQVADILLRLCKAGVVLEIVATASGGGEERVYAAHSVVRSHVLSDLGVIGAPNTLPGFPLAGYSAEVPFMQPGSSMADQVAARSVDRLLRAAEDDDLDKVERAEALRAAFGISRSRWTATAIARLGTESLDASERLQHTHYGSYMRRLSRLANAARALSGDEGWWDGEPSGEAIAGEIAKGHALFIDELAWLYNEMGLASFLRGSMPDAQALFRTGRTVNEQVERSLPRKEHRGQRWVESQMNLAIVSIERGHLERARKHLKSALSQAGAWKGGLDPELKARLTGHLALVLHLTGDYTQANRHYRDAIKGAKEAGNSRAVSLFSKHHADLCRIRRQFPQALEMIQQSIAVAESARHHDLLRYALVAEVNLVFTRGQEGAGGDHPMGEGHSIATLLKVERYARRAGLAKLEEETLIVYARLVMERGDLDLATRLTARCLGIASMNGLGLALTRSLVRMAQVLLRRGEVKEARALLRSCAQRAEAQRYQLQVEAAERELLKLPPAPDVAPGHGIRS